MRRTRLVVLMLGLSAPTWVAADTMHVAADAQTSTLQPATRFGTFPAMGVRQGPSGPILISHARFELAPLPTDPDVRKAVLRLWVFAVSAGGTVEVVPIVEPWNEATISGAASPVLGAPVASFAVAASDALHFVDVDITGLVQDWASGVMDNYGVALRGEDGGAVNVIFDTKESVLMSHAPELEVAVDIAAVASGDITAVNRGLGLTGGGESGDVTLAADMAVLQSRVSGICPPGSSIGTVNEDGTVACNPHGAAAGWSLTGNAGTIPGTNFIGTTDDRALELKVNGARALRLEPNGTSPNVVGGFSGNSVAPGSYAAVIAGGGEAGFPNSVTSHYGTVGGGVNNASGNVATVGGGAGNTSGPGATVGGGISNMASAPFATVGGGRENAASGERATVGGGWVNTASGFGSTVAGGVENKASGDDAAVPGGNLNEAGGTYSLAAGFRAKVRNTVQSGDPDGDEGTFVWADSTNADFQSTGPNKFLIRAGGGVGINTNAPSSALHVNGTATMTGLRLTRDPAAGYVLTSDAAGIGTWQPASGSSGDITAVNTAAGSGLQGGVTSGDANLSIADNAIHEARLADNAITAAKIADGTITSADLGTGSVVGGPGGMVLDNTITTEDIANDTIALADLSQNGCGNGQVIKWNGSAWACSDDDSTTGWSLTGNAGTIPGTHFIGTTDNQMLELRVHGSGALRLEPGSGIPNIVGGFPGNSVVQGVAGAVIAGGGDPTLENEITQSHGTVSGGLGNTASDVAATVGGGRANTASGVTATVGGGQSNMASGESSTVPGGLSNQAGGQYSFAAGRRAKVRDTAPDGDEGTFVWADSTDADFQSTGPNQFLIRAGGGVGINTNAPAAGSALDVNGTATMTGFRLTRDPAAGYVLTSDAAGVGTWQLAPTGGGDITRVTAGPGLSGGGNSGDVTLEVDPSVTQSRVTGTCAAGSSIRTVNQDGSVACETDDNTMGWGLTGNSGTNAADNFIGTTDDEPVVVRVNNVRALRLERVTTTIGGMTYAGQNILAGEHTTPVLPGVTQATIAGGGGLINGVPHFNQVTDMGGTVGGGAANRAGNNAGTLEDVPFATVAGGLENQASGVHSAVGGGSLNQASAGWSTVAGGKSNQADGLSSIVAGGEFNVASGQASAVGGGGDNRATGSYSAVIGGIVNVASGGHAIVLGGSGNVAGGDNSLAAGVGAKVRTPAQAGDSQGDQGTFVWADAIDTDFESTGPNQFLIRATGGVAINTASPAAGMALTVNGGTIVEGSTILNGGAILNGGTSITGDTTVEGNAVVIGNLDVTGNLSKGGGSFKIDHPLDPRNKYLSHSFVESPDMKNIYDGVVTTDGDGYATVELPEWFQALNRDFRYQLTVIGDGEWARARVSRKICDNRFVIQTDHPGVEVSWQVTGIRQDAWADAHRIRVEEEKPRAARGTCMHAEACASAAARSGGRD